IEAAAPDHLPWSTTVSATTAGQLVAIEVPRLDAAPVKPEPARPAPEAPPRIAKRDAEQRPAPAAPDRSDPHRRRVIGVAVGVSGVAAIGAGVALGLVARSKWSSAGMHCNGDVCDPTGLSVNRDARRLGDIGTIVGAAGTAVLAVGAVLYLTAP